MLHLAGRVALGVDVADLLELEGALERNWIVDAPAQEDHILGVGKQVGQVGAALVVVEHQLLQLGRQQAQGRHQGAQLGGSLDTAAAALGKGQGQAVEGQQLGQEGLGGGHPHLNAGADIEDVGHEPTQGALRPVGDAQEFGGEGGIGHQQASLLLHQ